MARTSPAPPGLFLRSHSPTRDRATPLSARVAALREGKESHAELTAHDLMHLGYKVRCYARLHPEGQRSVTGPVRAFEVWAWTCDEGEQIARHQTPAGEVLEPPIRWVSLAADEELPAR